METLTTSIIIVLYLILLFGVSAWAQKRQKKMEAQGGTGSFLMASKSLPTVLVAFMMAGAGIGSINTTGIARSRFRLRAFPAPAQALQVRWR